jgi:hypothetical protein
MSYLTLGTDLPELLQAQVLKDYAPKFPQGSPACVQWLASRGFYVTDRGTLDKRHRQAWLVVRKPDSLK